MADRPVRTDGEIEVTPGMIEAGVDVLSMYNPAEDDTAEWAAEVYQAMQAVMKQRVP